MVAWTLDTDDAIQTSATGIMRTFVKYISNKFDTLPVDENQIRDLLAHMKPRIPQEANIDLEAPITMEEMEIAVRQGKNVKAPGNDGINHEFLKNKWKTIRHDFLQILKDMYVDEAILNSQKHGIIVCVPKKRNPERPEDYRALTLLNADFKLLSRIIANRLKRWTKEIIHPSQHCGTLDTNIFGALAAIRETIAQVEMTNSPTCFLSLDFTQAFDKIAHTYLFAVLEHCGFSQTFLTRLKKCIPMLPPLFKLMDIYHSQLQLVVA